MTARPRLRRLAAVLAAAGALAAAAPGPAAAARDAAAVAALDADGVFVSPRALGEAAAPAAAELAAARARMLTDRRDVSFVIVPGPAGAATLTAYARRLHAAAALDGMLLVTAPGRGVAVAGAPVPAAAGAAIREARVARLANPVERLVAAAQVAVPAGPDDEDGLRSIAILLVLAGLGGAWAVAWGAHRTDRRGRDVVTEARSQLRVCVDALRAQAQALAGAHRPPPAAAAVDEALEVCTETIMALHDARTFDDVWTLLPRVRAGFDRLADAAGPGEAAPSASAPFAGLCTTDPAHGTAVTAGAVAGWTEPVPICAACRERLDDGRPVVPRLVPMGRGAVAYTAVAPLLRDSAPTSPPASQIGPLNA